MARHFVGFLATILAVLCLTIVPYRTFAGDRPFPASIDPAKRYLFYLHGAYVEKRGPNGDYRYHAILDALEKRDFIVIGEARGTTQFGQYADMVTAQVRRLLDAGVPMANIVIAGHSKGGFITLLVATRLQNPKARFGVLAACGRKGSEIERPYRSFVKRDAARLQGTFLVMWEKSDPVAADCDAAMKKAEAATFNNLILDVGGGHQLFYTPKASWIDPLVTFATAKSSVNPF